MFDDPDLPLSHAAPRSDDDTALSVSAVNDLVNDQLNSAGRLRIQGEIGSLTIARSGHAYITLRDRDAALNVTMWRSTVVRHSPFPQEGDAVIVSGRLENYAPRGSYSLIASSIRKAGAGDLAQQLAALQVKLTAAGLFAEDNKKTLPQLPAAIGIATAAGSAALADLLSGIVGRFPSMPVVFEDCRVQGNGAAQSIADAIASLDQHPDVSVIIVGRGGGSLEDLWAFNEEIVVRAIAACSTPIISAVGHETDHSLADLAADVRAKTPTMAAEIAVPLWDGLQEEIAWRYQQLQRAATRHLRHAQHQIAVRQQHRALVQPEWLLTRTRDRLLQQGQKIDTAATHILQRKQQRYQRFYDDFNRHVTPLIKQKIHKRHQQLGQQATELQRQRSFLLQQKNQKLRQQAQMLEALSPVATFARGWSVSYTENGDTIRDPQQVNVGDSIATRVAKGWVTSTVSDRSNDPQPHVSDQHQDTPAQRVDEQIVHYTPGRNRGSAD